MGRCPAEEDEGHVALGRRMEALRNGTVKRDKNGRRKSKRRVPVTFGTPLKWVVTTSVVVPVLQVSLLRFRVSDLTRTVN